MSGNSNKPWAALPSEILVHAIELLERDTETSRRLAFILVDNAVEQMITVYFSLPKRVTKLTISRRQLIDITSNFDSLLGALEEIAAEKLEGVDLDSLEWNHRLRNILYHQGAGLTIDATKVEIYIELAKILFKNLFGFSLKISSSHKADLVGKYIESVTALENKIAHLASEYSADALAMKIKDALRLLFRTDVLTNEQIQEVLGLHELRELLVQGNAASTESVTSEQVERAVSLSKAVGNLKHGHRRKDGPSPTYISWQGMIRGCTNPKDANYKNYGGLGITVCKKWRQFEGFLEDMGQRPPDKQLGRIDTSGNFEWNNCEWVTHRVQQNRLRSNRLLTYQGRTQNLTQWGEELGINPAIIHNRLRNAWSIEEALGRPVKTKPRRMYSARGKTQNLGAWSAETGIDRDTLRKRIERHGWTVERAIGTPVSKTRSGRKRKT